MEYPDFIIDKRAPIKISLQLRETLLEFTMNCLLEQPERVVPYAKEYFDHLIETEHTSMEYGEEISESISHEEVEDFDIPDEAMEYTRGRGKVVYSEAYNPEKDDDDDIEDTVYEKTEEQKTILMNVVSKCLLFRSLDLEQLHRVVDVMFPREVTPGDYVIKQYDDGDNFYIIEFGLYDVLMADEPDAEPKHIFTYQNAGNFGELALMYNMPRAATIRAQTEGRLWAMDRQTFRRIVLKAAFKKRKKYEELISKVPMLQEMTPYERMSLADALIPKKFDEGHVIIAEGDSADGMYFVEKGVVVCYMQDPVTFQSRQITSIGEGGYFGELALITKKPRAATVIADTDVQLAFLDVETFERLLGPCLELMERNVETYALQVHKLMGSEVM